MAQRTDRKGSDKDRQGGRKRAQTGPIKRKSCFFCKDKVDEIDKKTDGIYHLLQFDAEPETLDELSRILKITDGVMRHLATRRIEGRQIGTRPPEPVAVGDPEREDAGETVSASAEEEE